MTNEIKTRIICKPVSNKLGFFACFGDNEIYLFTQNYNKRLFQKFRSGVDLNEALSPGKRRNVTPPLEKMLDKLPGHIRYIEREYGVQLLHHHFRDNRVTLRKKAERMDNRYAA